MKLARAITNQTSDFRLLNVSQTTRHPERHGPFMVVQFGTVPGEFEEAEECFALTRRGTWLHGYLFFMLPSAVRRKVVVFESVPEVIEVVENLAGVPVVETVATLKGLLGEQGVELVSHDPEARALREHVEGEGAGGKPVDLETLRGMQLGEIDQ